MTQTFKILVTGPFAAGKTSLIQSVSQTRVISTDVATTSDEAAVKSHTTVAMDFGTFVLDEAEPDDPSDGEAEPVRLLLFGTPGQQRFRFMTDILKADADVVAFVIDATAEHTHADAGVELRELLRDLHVPCVVAVNRCDDLETARRLARALGALDGEAAVPCQLIDPESGREVVIEILLTLLASMEAQPEPGVPGFDRAEVA
ncbi:MAG: ATP/GTP-binding protein [Actinomycetota bacterium]